MYEKNLLHPHRHASTRPWRSLSELAELWGTSGERTRRLANWLAQTGRLEVKSDGEDLVLYRLPEE